MQEFEEFKQEVEAQTMNIKRVEKLICAYRKRIKDKSDKVKFTAQCKDFLKQFIKHMYE